LSEAASARGGLDGVARILRPNAPVIAAELAPSIFWDIVRGSRPAWWTRSVDAEFPIGALLTGPEWIDEFRAAGFTSVEARPVLGDRRLGVVVRGVVSASDDSEIGTESPVFAWKGDIAAMDGSVLAMVARQLDGQALAHQAETGSVRAVRPDGHRLGDRPEKAGVSTGRLSEWSSRAYRRAVPSPAGRRGPPLGGNGFRSPRPR
jgi:hypothetical protein